LLYWRVKKNIRLEWLRSNYAGSKESDSDEPKTRCVRAYLLYMIGCFVCCDKYGNKVSIHFLQCLRKVTQVNTYSWATVCLCWLSRNLGQSTQQYVHQMTGCMTLLQVSVQFYIQILYQIIYIYICFVGLGLEF